MGFKVGDKVRIVDNITNHKLEIGNIYKIEKVCDYGDYKVDGWYVGENEIAFVCDLSNLTLKEILDIYEAPYDSKYDYIYGFVEDCIKWDNLSYWLDDLSEGMKIKIVNTNTFLDGVIGYIYDIDFNQDSPYIIRIEETEYSDDIYIYVEKDNIEVI